MAVRPWAASRVTDGGADGLYPGRPEGGRAADADPGRQRVPTALAVSLALAAYAFAQRGQAVSREHTAASLALSAASDKVRDSNLGAALVLGHEAYRARPSADARNSVLSSLERARRFGLQAVLCCHDGALDSLAFSADGTIAAAGADGGSVLVWDVPGRRPLARIEDAHESAVHAIAFSPDEQTVASAGEDGTVGLWKAATGDALGRLGATDDHLGGIVAIAFSPDGRKLAAGSSIGESGSWDVGSQKALGEALAFRPSPGPGSITSLAYSADGDRLAFATAGEGIRGIGSFQVINVWDTRTHKMLGVFSGASAGTLAFFDDRLAAIDVAGGVESRSLADLGSSSPGRGFDVKPTRPVSSSRVLGRREAGGTRPVGRDDRGLAARAEQSVSPCSRATTAPSRASPSAARGQSRAAGEDGTVMIWSIAGRAPIGLPLSKRAYEADYGYEPEVGGPAVRRIRVQPGRPFRRER